MKTEILALMVLVNFGLMSQKQIKIGTSYMNGWAIQQGVSLPSQKIGIDGGFQLGVGEKGGFLIMVGAHYGANGLYGTINSLLFSFTPEYRVYLKEKIKGFYLGGGFHLNYNVSSYRYYYSCPYCYGDYLIEPYPYYSNYTDLQYGVDFNTGFEFPISEKNTLNPYINIQVNPFQRGYNLLGKMGFNVSF